MAANRALVVPGPQGNVIEGDVGSASGQLFVNYILLNTEDEVVGPADGLGHGVTNLVVPLTYESINNITGTIVSAVRANEHDSSLQVFVF